MEISKKRTEKNEEAKWQGANEQKGSFLNEKSLNDSGFSLRIMKNLHWLLSHFLFNKRATIRFELFEGFQRDIFIAQIYFALLCYDNTGKYSLYFVFILPGDFICFSHNNIILLQLKRLCRYILEPGKDHKTQMSTKLCFRHPPWHRYWLLLLIN